MPAKGKVYAVMVFNRYPGESPWLSLDTIHSTSERARERMMTLAPRMVDSGNLMAEEGPPTQTDFDSMDDYLKAYSEWMQCHISAYVKEMEIDNAR